MSDTGAAKRLHELPVEWLRYVCSPVPQPAPALLADVPIDWDGIAADASSHAVAVLVWNRLKEAGAERHLPSDVRESWEAADRHARLQTILQQRDADEISGAFAAAGVRHAFVKGSAYRQWLYRPSWARVGADLDLLIAKEDAERARAVMFELGFYHASCNAGYTNFRPAPRDLIEKTEQSHYELAQLVRSSNLVNRPAWLLAPPFERRPPFTFERIGDGVQFHTVVDIHWTMHFWFADESPLDELAATAEGELPRLPLPWNLLITFFKLYFEAFDRPYYGFHHLADLAAMLRTQPADSDWARVDAFVQKYGLWAAAFYTLRAAATLAGPGSVPDELLESWGRTAPSPAEMSHQPEKRTWHTAFDLGDFIPYMTGNRGVTRLGTLSRPAAQPRKLTRPGVEEPRPDRRREAHA